MKEVKLNLSALKALRQKALEAVIKHGFSQRKACQVFGFSASTLSKYIRHYKQSSDQSFDYKTRGRKPGTCTLLNRKQEERLIEDVVKYTPDQLGLDHTLWTSKIVNEYLQKTFTITYSERGMRQLMTRLGFSSQKPMKLAYQRDPAKIDKWLQDTYPKIKTKAMVQGARIYWADEMGLQSTDNRGRTYGLKGQTPVIRKTGSRFKCNMLAAISPQGFMNWMVFEDNFTSQKFIEFLGRMVRQVKQKIFLIVDNHKAHHSHKVQNYLARHQDKIEIFYLPPYCPDMNPQELVNQDVKAHCSNFRVIKTMTDLTINLRLYLTKIQFNSFKIINYFNKKEVLYAA